MRLRFPIFLIFLFSAAFSTAQENPAVVQFEIVQVHAGAQLNFTLASGNTCLGIRILRSDDNTSFSEIGFIGGVCGSVSDNVSYSYTDSMPLANKVGYYQLDLELLGTSTVHSFRFINYGSESVVAIPNISEGLFHLYFQNPRKAPVRLTVYDLNGRKIKETDYPGINSIELDLSNERAGEFIFNINIDLFDNYSGKLIVY